MIQFQKQCLTESLSVFLSPLSSLRSLSLSRSFSLWRAFCSLSFLDLSFSSRFLASLDEASGVKHRSVREQEL